ncbi:MAG: hypothetical protein GC160_07520 [Acidobacteria bacterium]|nr:hypothetical protein [Acidobacteriota bacterium]
MQKPRVVMCVFAVALALNAQARPCGGGAESSLGLRYICTKGNPEEYFVRFPKAMLSGDSTSTEVIEVPIELLNLGEPAVSWDVIKRPEELPYRYSYALSNGSHARRAIWSWALVVPGEDDSSTLSHPLWRFTSPASLATNARIASQAAISDGTLGKFARWTTTLEEHPIEPGQALAEFVVDSAFRPGWTTAYVSAGKGIEVPFEMPSAVHDELATLQKPENEQSVVLTIGPKFGPESAPRWIASDWRLGVQKMVDLGGLTAESDYVRELLHALEQLATAESQTAVLTVRIKPANGLEERVHRAVSLALAPVK